MPKIFIVFARRAFLMVCNMSMEMPSTITINRGDSKFIQIAAIVLFRREPNVWHTCSRVSSKIEEQKRKRKNNTVHIALDDYHSYSTQRGLFWIRLHENESRYSTTTMMTTTFKTDNVEQNCDFSLKY